MIYLDSCVLIYAIEDQGYRGEAVRTALAHTSEILVVSPLVLHECLIGPLSANQFELRDRYRQAYDRLAHQPLDLRVLIRAAELRAATGLKTPDAIHVAAATISGCDQLWTNDTRLANAVPGLAVDVVPGGDK